jgi:hypothetical protein
MLRTQGEVDDAPLKDRDSLVDPPSLAVSPVQRLGWAGYWKSSGETFSMK